MSSVTLFTKTKVLDFAKAAAAPAIVLFCLLQVLRIFVKNIICYDFPSYYYASRLMEAGGNPYAWEQLSATAPEGLVIYPFLYSPIALYLFKPLGFLSFQLAQLILGLISVASLTFLFWASDRIAQVVSSRVRSPRISGTVGLLMLPAILLNIRCAQINIILAALVAASILLAERDKPIGSGFILALAALIKLLPLGFAAYFLYRKQYRAAAWSAIFTFLLFGVSFFLTPNLWHEFVAGLQLAGYGKTAPGLVPPSIMTNVGFAGMFARMFGNGTTASVISAFAVVLLGVGMFWRFRRILAEPLNAGILLTLLAFFTIFVPPLAWRHYMVLALPGLVLLVAQGSELAANRKKWQLFLGASILLACTDMEIATRVYGKVFGWSGLDYINAPPPLLQLAYAVNLLAAISLVIIALRPLEREAPALAG